MNIFKRLQKSQRSGLLSDKMNLVLVILLVMSVLLILGLLVGRVSVYDSSLPLRYSTLDGYYDRGNWSRPYVIFAFTFLMSIFHIAAATFLYKQKNYYTAKAILVIPLVFSMITAAVVLHVVTGTTL